MTNPISVNRLLEQLSKIDQHPLEVEGILEIHSEGYSLRHYPKSERQRDFPNGDEPYESGVWLATGQGSIQFNNLALERWHGKRVRVHGIAQSHSSLPHIPAFHARNGFGPWGAWPAQLEVYSIQRVTSEERREA